MGTGKAWSVVTLGVTSESWKVAVQSAGKPGATRVVGVLRLWRWRAQQSYASRAWVDVASNGLNFKLLIVGESRNREGPLSELHHRALPTSKRRLPPQFPWRNGRRRVGS